MSRKNVVGNHVHVILLRRERREREREIESKCANFYLVRSMKKLNTIFFTQLTKM